MMIEAVEIVERFKDSVSQIVLDNKTLRTENHNLKQKMLNMEKAIIAYRDRVGVLSEQEIEDFVKKLTPKYIVGKTIDQRGIARMYIDKNAKRKSTKRKSAKK